MIPAFSIRADGDDVTARLQDRLIELRLTDKQGLEADELEITLSDHDGALNLPRRGAVLRAAIGWRGDLVEKGAFTVDEVTHSGPPDAVTITARSADFQGAFKEQREASYDGETLGDILRAIAARQSLTAAVAPVLDALEIDHVDQTNESDIHFLTRLGADYDAVATVKAGHLLFVPIGAAITAGGGILAPASIARTDTERHSFTVADRDGTVTGVKAKWRHIGSSTTRYALAGTDGTVKTLKRDYPNEAEALRAAMSEWAKLQRAKREISLTLAMGRADIIANQPLTLTGFRPEIDGVSWMAGDITHTVGDGGFVTEIRAMDAG